MAAVENTGAVTVAAIPELGAVAGTGAVTAEVVGAGQGTPVAVAGTAGAGTGAVVGVAGTEEPGEAAGTEAVAGSLPVH